MTETVTVVQQMQPEPESALMSEGTEADPTIVRLDTESTALLLLVGCLSVACLGAMTVSAWRN